MRVTNQSSYLRTMGHINRARNAESQAMQQLASGKRISRLSDDPGDVASIRKTASSIENIESRISLAQTAESHFATYDAALQNGQSIIGRLQQLTVQMGSDTYNASNREAAAEEFEALRGALLSVANTEVDGRYVFAGNATSTQPFDAAGAYQGDSELRQIQIGPGNTTTINIPGDEAFGTAGGGADVFAVIDAAITALRANDGQGIRDQIDGFEQVGEQLGQLQVRVGGRLASVAYLRETNEDGRVREAEVLSRLRDTDLAEAATALASAQLGVQAALATTAKIGQLSLLDML